MGVRTARRAIKAFTGAVSLVAIGLASLPAAEGAPPAVDPQLTVQSVTLGRSSVAVSGLNVVPVQVEVSASHPVPDMPLSVVLERTAPGGPLESMVAVNLARISTAAGPGVWRGTLQVPSTAAGTFKVTSVLPGVVAAETWPMTDPTPYDGPALSVTGVHRPRIVANTYPNPVPVGSEYALGGKVIDSATGLPYGTRISVEIGVDNTCAELRAGRPAVRSTTAGTFAHRLPPTAADWPNCVILRNGDTYIDRVGVGVRRPGELGARPSATSGRVGTAVPVYGTAKDAALHPVELQRLRGDSQWRRVALSRVRESGRFTLLAPLTRVGTPIFRAYLPRYPVMPGSMDEALDAATSPFLIRAR